MVMKEKAALSNLPELMQRLTHNVNKFNLRVISTSLNLKRNGSSAQDLLHELFPAYLVCPDKQFHDYIRTKQNKFEEGLEKGPDYFMKCARFKYKTLLDKGEWEAPDAQGKEILMLYTEINGLKRGKKNPSETKTTSKSGNKNKRGRGDDRAKSKTKEKRNYSWQVIAPKGKEPTSLTKFSKTYHWCSSETSAPKGNVYDKWVCNDPSAYEGWSKKKRNPN